MIEKISVLAAEAKVWRRDLHRHPELQYDVHRTAGLVADLLRQFGCDRVVTGIGRTGVVGIVKGQRATATQGIAIRADMDALPIEEAVNRPYRSGIPGRMHACGHDGHTAMLLGAAKYLAETRDFEGTAFFVFQPAEEGGNGAEAMLQDGLMSRFAIDEIYALHNMPDIPVGHFAIRPGPILAASDQFRVTIVGKGGHAARPHETVDPVLIAAHLITMLQSIVSRNVDPLQSAVVTVGALNTGETHNVIPQSATLLGTVRAMDEANRNKCELRIREMTAAVSSMFDASASIEYSRGHPVTSNHHGQTAVIKQAAVDVSGSDSIDDPTTPLMGSEDFSFMLQVCPGAYIFLGNGESMPLHHPEYDFNDEAIPYGIALWVRLIERRLAGLSPAAKHL